MLWCWNIHSIDYQITMPRDDYVINKMANGAIFERKDCCRWWDLILRIADIEQNGTIQYLWSEDHICFEFIDKSSTDLEGKDHTLSECHDGSLIYNVDPQASCRPHIDNTEI